MQATMGEIGKILITIGSLILFIGFILIGADRLGIHLGRLPGDIIYRKGNTTIYFPIVTSILISILLSVILWLFRR